MIEKSWEQLQADQQEWDDKCNANWHTKAAQLVADGWTQHDQPDKIIPAVFTKGNQTIHLARKLGSSQWYTVKGK